MEIYEKGEIWEDKGNDLTYSYTKVILKQGDTFFSAQTTVRLGSSIDIDKLDPISIPIEDIRPPYSTDLTLAPTPLPVDNYIKRSSLLDCGNGPGTRPSDLFLAEARTCELLMKFPYPNVAEYFGCVCLDNRTEGLCFVKYERTLAARLAEGGSLDRVEVCGEIKLGIQHLHWLGLSHNDINPYNIMFKSDGTPVIIDFDSC
jgi:hypothetical protein